MLGKRSDQRGLWEADHLYLDLVGRDSFYGRLAGLRGQLFGDEDFAALYCRDNGRSSVPPSLLATALLLQAHDKVSDAEAHRRATVDLSWKVALGVEVEVRPFAQSTLQHFRAQLVLRGQMRELFRRSLEMARTQGLLRGRSLQVALDTTPILGRGAMKDTYNLLADGIRQLLRTLARVQDQELTPWAEGQGYARYLAASVKGTAEIDSGMSPRLGRRSWPRLWPMRTACWRRPGTPRRAVRPTARTGTASWPRPSSWAHCCTRMWTGRRRAYASHKG